MLTPELSFRKLQQFVPHVLERNFTDFAVQLQFLLQKGIVAMQPIGVTEFPEIAQAAEGLRMRMLSVFELDGT